ncbi:hypothetical protein WDW89_18445, partial [Deltaproteobacteria bacterium TL4]
IGTTCPIKTTFAKAGHVIPAYRTRKIKADYVLGYNAPDESDETRLLDKGDMGALSLGFDMPTFIFDHLNLYVMAIGVQMQANTLNEKSLKNQKTIADTSVGLTWTRLNLRLGVTLPSYTHYEGVKEVKRDLRFDFGMRLNL